MFSTYYYTQYHSDIIYYTHNLSKERYEFYVNDKLIKHIDGTFGEFNFEHEVYHLRIKTKIKTTHHLSISGKEVQLINIRKKELQNILSGNDINNEVNPTIEQIQQNRFNPQTLLIPILLIIAGFTIQYFTQGSSHSTQLIPMIPEAIAGWMLYDIVSKRVSWLKNFRKGRIGFMAIVIVGVGLIGELLFNYF